MPDLEAVDGAATQGQIACSVEPAAGEAPDDGHTHESACLNCGKRLSGPYCSECGQQAHVHRTIGAFFHDLLHGAFHFEGKIWRTLSMLALRPGELTRQYIEGRRAGFVSPIALFLFSVFLMFAVVNVLGGTVIGAPTGTDAQEQAELREAEQEIRVLEARREERVGRRESTAAVDAELRQARSAYSIVSLVNGGAREPIRIQSGWARLDRGVEKASKNPALLFYKLQNLAYKFSWALIPISVPFVWLLFLHRRGYRQRFGAYDHSVFVTYSIGFMTLLFALVALTETLGMGGITPLLIALVPPVHLYRQLRGAYALGRWSAAWRAIVLLVFTGLALTVFLLLLLALGVIG